MPPSRNYSYSYPFVANNCSQTPSPTRPDSQGYYSQSSHNYSYSYPFAQDNCSRTPLLPTLDLREGCSMRRYSCYYARSPLLHDVAERCSCCRYAGSVRCSNGTCNCYHTVSLPTFDLPDDYLCPIHLI